jgi:hypothetical protein
MSSVVSIIIPCYNQAQYLDECLKSVLEQTYANWECVIVNDGSLDETEKVALQWVDTDCRFVYYFKKNEGVSNARNFGIEKATGDYIQFLDADDLIDSKKLELSLKEINQVTNIVISNFSRFVDDPKNVIPSFCNLKQELFNFNAVLLKWESVFSIPIHCGFFKSDLFHDFRFSPELKTREDWMMWLYLFQKEMSVVFIDEPLAYYRVNLKGVTHNPQLMLENHKKAIFYIKDVISQKDYIDYLVFELKQKFEENSTLKSTIDNIKKTTSYKVAEKIKKIFFVKYFFKIITK